MLVYKYEIPQNMATRLSPDEVEKYIAESVFKAAEDSVINVKEVAAQCLLSLVQTKKFGTKNIEKAVGLVNQFLPEVQLGMDLVDLD